MRIGLYLQDKNEKRLTAKIFDAHIKKVKEAHIDLLVFPENCYIFPFEIESVEVDIINSDDQEAVYNRISELAQLSNCAIIYSSMDIGRRNFSMFVNPFASETETQSRLYIKHTATVSSAFDFENYGESIEYLFEPIEFKDKKIGMTICYDCNHSMFSRTYGRNGVDILINSTGGNVVYNKWYRYNKVRAIENNCINLCTMGYTGDYKNPNSYVFGFTPQGKYMSYQNITSKKTENNAVGNIFVFDTETQSQDYETDLTIGQKESINKDSQFDFEIDSLGSMLTKAQKIKENLYVLKNGQENIVFCMIKENNILLPEYISSLMYDESLKKYKSKRYLIVNHWNILDEDYYKTILSDVLKVRVTESYCAALLLSPNYKKCYQTGQNKVAQVVKMVNNSFAIDLKRTSGPETIWKKTPLWREKYEILIQYSH